MVFPHKIKGKGDGMKKLFLLGVIVIFLAGCHLQTDSNKKVRDLDFTVIDEGAMPKQLLQVLEERKAEPFKLTYQDDGLLYLCAGYGEQATGGYSIAVEDLYLTENAIYFDTTLIGPVKGEPLVELPSYPYLVIATEDLELPVVFR